MPLDLNRFFLEEGDDLNFFQAVYLLEKIFADRGRPGTGDDLSSEPVRFETLNSLSFPGSDVAAILPPLSLRRQAQAEETARGGSAPPVENAAPEIPLHEMVKTGKPLRVALTFMGLYGVSSPLPSYFVDPITLRKIEYFELKKFLDIFNHRLYSLFYRAWKKYRHFAQLPSGAGPDDYTLRLLALTGQWPRKSAKLDKASDTGDKGMDADIRRIPYARFLGNRVRSARGLQQLLTGYFGFQRVQVRQFTASRVDIPVKTRLGEASVELGISTRLGDTMEDSLSRFTVEIGPLPRALFFRFFPAPDGDGSDEPRELPRRVRNLIDAYLRDPMDYEIKVMLAPDPQNAPALGLAHSRLGMGVWLGREPAGEIACRL